MRTAPDTRSPGDAADTRGLERLAAGLFHVRRLCPGLPVLAIQWFHLRHPLYPEQEALLATDDNAVAGKRSAVGVIGGLRACGKCLAHATWLSLRLVRLRWCLRHEIRALKRREFDVVAKTWCYGRPSAGGEDFYYGDLQSRLAARGVRALLLCGEFNGSDWITFARTQVALGESARLPELCLVSTLAPISMAIKQVVAAARLGRIARRGRNALVRRISERASAACLSSATTRTGLFFWIACAATRIWRPQTFLTLYEGQAWEKCAWWGVKTAAPSCTTVGYQHTPIRPKSEAFTRPRVDMKARSLPDVVVNLGHRTRELMQAGHERHGTRLVCFGSFQRQAVRARTPADPSRRTVLVVPEGIPAEISLLFGFAYDCARRLPAYRFILRSHPYVPIDKAVRFGPDGIGGQENVEISSYVPIDADYERSSVVLYRGSAAALYAVTHGLKPVYLHQVGRPFVDPLFELGGWREYVSSVREMEETLERHVAQTEGGSEEWRSAVEYVDAYAVPVDDASIDGLLGAVRIRDGCPPQEHQDVRRAKGPR